MIKFIKKVEEINFKITYPVQTNTSARGKLNLGSSPRSVSSPTLSTTSGSMCKKVVQNKTPPPNPKSIPTILEDLFKRKKIAFY